MVQLVFGQRVLSSSKIREQAREAKHDTATRWRQAWNRLYAAYLDDDPTLHYCIKCHRVIGWKQYSFSHGCGLDFSSHGGYKDYWYTDIQSRYVDAVAGYPMPGTLWHVE